MHKALVEQFLPNWSMLQNGVDTLNTHEFPIDSLFTLDYFGPNSIRIIVFLPLAYSQISSELCLLQVSLPRFTRQRCWKIENMADRVDFRITRRYWINAFIQLELAVWLSRTRDCKLFKWIHHIRNVRTMKALYSIKFGKMGIICAVVHRQNMRYCSDEGKNS